LRVRYRIATCAIDGIAVSTGCSQADGSLVVVDEGSHQLSSESSRGSVVVTIRSDILELAGEFRRFDNALEAERAELSPEVLRQRLDEREQRLDLLLVELCRLPEERLLLIEQESEV
jgi:formylmethanofuran dehydrogenase subunit E